MMTIKTFTPALLASAVLLSALSLRAEPNDFEKNKEGTKSTASAKYSTGKNDPATCIQEAGKMNTATIKFAQLAQQKAENSELKRFGQMLEKDHQDAQAKLQKLAQKHNVTLSDSLEEKCQQELAKLEGLSGAEFDKEFAQGAVEGHAMAAAHLEQASKQAKDADLSQYTRDMLAKVKTHQRHAREIAQLVGVDQATITSLESKARDSVGAAGQSETSTETSTTTKEQDR